MATAELPSRSASFDGTAETAATATDHWVVERNPRPHTTYAGGQAAFPGGWLELGGETLRRMVATVASSASASLTGTRVTVEESGTQNSLESKRTVTTALPRPLRWVARSQAYVEAPEGEELQVTRHCLDKSPEVLELAGTVASWREEVSERVQKGGKHGASDAEGEFYVKIATALGNKLATNEAEQKQDYASEILALRGSSGNVVGVMDCYERSKTRSLILKYALAHPGSQRPAAEREDGTLGGIGRACLSYLVSRAAQEDRCPSVRMEALSLRLYLSASSLGFEQIGTTVPPLPQDVFLPHSAVLCSSPAAHKSL